MREHMKAYLGNPVYLRLRGYEKESRDIFGVLEHDGKHYVLRTGSRKLEFSARDVLNLRPFNRSHNYFRDGQRLF